MIFAGIGRLDDQQHDNDRDIGHNAEQRRNGRRNKVVDDGLQRTDKAEDQRIDTGLLRILTAAVNGAQADKAAVRRHVDGIHAELLNRKVQSGQCGETAGQFPKFADEVYKIENPTDDRMHFMLPTAETALASLHRGEILAESDLPHKLFAYTPCFRREAGSHRADERGMVRGHQFNKIEMFQYTLPEKSDEAFEELVGKAERLVKGLGFHFRTVKLAAGDCSASMARTYDIEIQIPSMNGYKEVSSVSNARDYQARRGNIRFRREATGKTEFVHTLNGSGLATSRIFPAMVEQNQRADGSVVVPEVLRKYLGGLEVLEKKNF